MCFVFGFAGGRYRCENTPGGKGGICNLKQVKTLNTDSPQGEYTRRKGLVCSTSQKSKPRQWIPRREIHPAERAAFRHLKMEPPRGEYTRQKGFVLFTNMYMYI